LVSLSQKLEFRRLCPQNVAFGIETRSFVCQPRELLFVLLSVSIDFRLDKIQAAPVFRNLRFVVSQFDLVLLTEKLEFSGLRPQGFAFGVKTSSFVYQPCEILFELLS
jgi:hypothetical protein